MERLRAAILFPGQGVTLEDMVACAQRIQVLNLGLFNGYMGRMRDAFSEYTDEYLPTPAELIERGIKGPIPTKWVQPIVYTLSMMAQKIFKDSQTSQRYEICLEAGHSLGENTAATAAGAMDFEQACRVIAQRGLATQEACDSRPGSMIRVKGIPAETVRSITQPDGPWLALQNAPNITVLSCRREQTEEVVQEAKGLGATEATSLGISGAFHSPLMDGVEKLMRGIFARNPLRDTEIPLVVNINAALTSKADELANNLAKGLTSTARWAESLSVMAERVDAFIELGPGKSLTILSRINRVKVRELLNFNDMQLTY